MSVYGLTTTFILGNYGSVSHLIVYSDSLYLDRTETINWGTLIPDTVENRTVYVENVGDKALTLNLTATNWVPSNATDYLSFTWTGDSVIDGYAKRPYILYLTVHANVTESSIGDFSFDIIVDGTW